MSSSDAGLMPNSRTPDLGVASVALAAATSQRACGSFAIAMLLASLLVAASPADAQARDSGASAPNAPRRAEDDGGNPPYYEVFGKRYRVRASSDGYVERGVASWYGRPYHGRQTSSGETYNMHALTAAHPTLPIPTWVQVTNLANGRRVVVKVNDRGPFVGRRLIDLSYAAARALDMVRDGTARVEVRALSGPPPETTAGRRDKRAESALSARERSEVAASLPPPSAKSRPDSPEPADLRSLPADSSLPAQSDRLFAEAGKFKRREDAVEVVDRLRAEGFFNAFVVTEDRRRRPLHRVRIGPLHDAAEVASMSGRLRGLGARHAHSVAMP